MKTFALFGKPDSPQSWGVLHEIVSWAEAKGMKTIVGAGHGGWTGTGWDPEFCLAVRRDADMALTIGGDGTLLGVARSLFGWDKPLLGVNLGRLGFLTDIAADAIERMLDSLKAGEYAIEDRILLEASIEGQTVPALAFNEVVLSKGESGRLVEFDVFVDGQPVFALRADGLIVSTPTGSTAYALSANGPILHPALAAIALVPLCPHSLTLRPITLPSTVKVEVVVRGDACRVHCDGQPFGGPLADGSRVTIVQGKTTVKMLHLGDYNIFQTLQQKLGWSAPGQR